MNLSLLTAKRPPHAVPCLLGWNESVSLVSGLLMTQLSCQHWEFLRSLLQGQFPKQVLFIPCLLCIKINFKQNITTSTNNIVISVWNGSSREYLTFYVQEYPLFWFSSSYFSDMRLNPWEYVTNVYYWKMYIPCYLKHLITKEEKNTNIKQIIKTSFSISI